MDTSWMIMYTDLISDNQRKQKRMIRILFICHGNICRSVSAQYILQNMVSLAGRKDQFLIDSAATSSEETGNPIYLPMKHALEKEGIPIGNHHARKLMLADYERFDLLIGMDEENRWNMEEMFPDDMDHKIHLLMEYTDHPDEVIEDPWYTRQFSLCVKQLEEGCSALLRKMINS